MKCDKCATDYPSQHYFAEPGLCIYCRDKLSRGEPIVIGQPSGAAEPFRGSRLEQEPVAVTIIRVFAWVSLIGGIILAVIVFALGGGLGAVAIPIAVALLLQCLLAWAATLAFAGLAGDVHHIRVMLSSSREARERGK
jgi:hypothetical protein